MKKLFFLAFSDALKKMSAILIFFYYPLVFIQVVDLYLNSRPAKFLLIDIPLSLIMYIAVVVIFSFFSALLTILTKFFVFKKKEVFFTNVFLGIVFFLIIYEFYKSTELWFQKVFDFRLIIPFNLKFSAVFFFLSIFLIFRKRILTFIQQCINPLIRPAMVISLIAFFISFSYIGFIYFSGKNSESANLQHITNSQNLPNIILITFDALTSEDMSLYGYHLKTTPNIEEFAKESYVFKNMYANSNWTRPTVTSILTGVYPIKHKLINPFPINKFLPKDLQKKNLASILKANGYTTVAVVSNLVYAHPFVNDTFRDFDYKPYFTVKFGWLDILFYSFFYKTTPFFYKLESSVNVILEFTYKRYSKAINKIINKFTSFLIFKKYIPTDAPAELTFNIALNYLKNTSHPFFLWIHVFPPHDPYLPPEPYKQSFLKDNSFLTDYEQQQYLSGEFNPKDENIKLLISKLKLRYDEHILYADHEFGKFLKELKKLRLYDNSLIILSADHGESFEHNYTGHSGPFLYNNLIHIPLIIHLPGQKHSQVVEQPAEQVDIFPTILDLINLEIPKWADGESLKLFIMQKNYLTKKPKFSMNFEGNNIL